MPRRARDAFGLLVLLQIAHSVEEYFGRLWESFPPARMVSGLVSSDLERGFFIFNIALIAFALWCWLWPVRLGWRSATPLAWVFVTIGLVNGIGHPLWSIGRGGYTPGVATAPFILLAALYLASQLLRPDSGTMRGRSSITVTARPEDNSIKAILSGTSPSEEEPYDSDLPLLTPSRNKTELEWLERSITTFARNVASFLPGHFEAYVRIYHPFENGGNDGRIMRSWNELAASAGVKLTDPKAAEEFAYHGVENAQARVGRRPKILLQPLIEHLRSATSTPEQCFFAVWEGFGGFSGSSLH